MKILFISMALTGLLHAQHHEAPGQLISMFSTPIITKTCIKACCDPIVVPTIAIASCAHCAHEVPCLKACALGLTISSLCLAYATDCNETKFDYYSVNAFALLKKGLFTVFPCMESRFSDKDKTE